MSKKERHRLLQRQLRKHFGEDFVPHPDWERFLTAVDEAYTQFEQERALAERSLELSSQELLSSNAELRSVIQALPDLVLRLDAQGNILARGDGTHNLVLARIHGQVGQRLQDSLTPPLAARITAAIQRVIQGRAVISLEYACGADSHPVFCEARLVPHLEDQVVITIRNITDRKRAEAELEKAHHELLDVSRQAGMAEVATGVLHNVGNVLNSVNISSSCVLHHLQTSKLATLTKLSSLIQEHRHDFPQFVAEDPKGRQLPQFIEQLSAHLQREQECMIKELNELQRHVDHIKEIVTMQQNFARVSAIHEKINPSELFEDAVHLNLSLIQSRKIEVVRHFATINPILVERHKVIQILVNLIRNAIQSCESSRKELKAITLTILQEKNGLAFIVADNGLGIAPENLNRIFNHGFTTKRDGHGFGLHSGALAAKEMGGSLAVESDGVGLGARFTLRIPPSAVPQSSDTVLTSIEEIQKRMP